MTGGRPLSRRRRGRDIAIQDILGKRVRDAAGRHAGRIEEIIAEPSGSQVLVREFQLGAYAALERFAR